MNDIVIALIVIVGFSILFEVTLGVSGFIERIPVVARWIDRLPKHEEDW